MGENRIIVIGASSGGFEPLKTIAAGLPKDLGASVFIVWHMSADARSVLPQVLNRIGTLDAANAYDGETIVPGRIYIAPPDRHLLIEKSHLRVTRGPKENLFRPAIDPLFRSAAYHHNQNVIGVVLSGALDDGTAGLWTIKHRGGTAIVQSPVDAEVPSMPENALREVEVDHIVAVEEIPALLITLVSDKAPDLHEAPMHVDDKEDKRIQGEIRIAAEDNALESGVFEMGDLSPYTCPECHGVLTSLREGRILRFRCHTGHAFSPDSLLSAVTGNIEDSMWDLVRGLDESMILLNHLGDHFAEANEKKLAALYFQKAQDAERRKDLIREALMTHERLSADSLRHEAQNGGPASAVSRYADANSP